MSAYKGEGGYVIENCVYDYTGVFDDVYTWAEYIKMPFQMPDGAIACLKDKACILQSVTVEDFKEYLQILHNSGYYTKYVEEGTGYIYNDKLVAVFQYNTDSENEWYVYVFTGFVKQPLLDVDTVKKLIDDSKLLEKDEKFNKYFVIPIENETVRSAGYYECLIFSEKSYEDIHNMEYRPYYMITDGENICLLEKYGYSHLFPSSSLLVEKNGRKELTLISGYYYFNVHLNSENRTVMFTYEWEDNRFVKTDTKELVEYNVQMPDEGNGLMVYIGKQENGEVKIYRLFCRLEYNETEGNRREWCLGDEVRLDNIP